MFKLMGKEINAILGAQTMLILTYVKCIFTFYLQVPVHLHVICAQSPSSTNTISPNINGCTAAKNHSCVKSAVKDSLTPDPSRST